MQARHLLLGAALVACWSCAGDGGRGDSNLAADDAGQGPGSGPDGPAAGSGGTAGDAATAHVDAGDISLVDGSSPQPDAQAPLDGGPTDAGVDFAIGVNVHNYPKPTAYGYLAADGADRMGAGLTELAVRYVRGPTIGDVDFLARLASFGVTHVILGLDAKAYGKPFDAAKLKTALDASLAETERLGLVAVVEGLNEWDLFNTRTYNDGVRPAGVDASAFVTLTQQALYEAAHPLGIPVLGPSVGHGQDQANLDFFPDVSAYVDIVNMHLYFGQMPESLVIASIVADHEAFQGTGKPLWVTETGVSAYATVTEEIQADVISRGLTHFASSGLIDVAFLYQLIDTSESGWQGTTFVPDSAEYHFGLFHYAGAARPAAAVVKTAVASL